MAWLLQLRRAFDGRFGWRLLAVFCVASLLPLALSDWLATSVITDLSRKLYQSRRAELTHDVSRQLLDKLLTAKAMLAVLAENGSVAPNPNPRSHFAGMAPFRTTTCQVVDEAASVSRPPVPEIPRASAPLGAASLGIVRSSAHLAKVMMRVDGPARRRCVAELNPDWLWEPVQDAGDEATWSVREEDGSVLVSNTAAGSAARDEPREPFIAHLFLVSEFGAPSWTVEQLSPVDRVTWHGRPIIAWLLSVAVATLLGTGLIGNWTLRRALVPLRQLNDAARRLAAGAWSARVDVQRGDEFGELSNSFNDMARQLELRIGSMHGLAQIDAGILSGEPLSKLVRRVLEQLMHLRPDTGIAILWREPDGGFYRVSSGEPGTVRSLTSSPRAAAEFDGCEDGIHPAAAIDCLQGDKTFDPQATLHLLSVRERNRVLALVCLSLASERAPDLSGCAALRDRLSVAFATRSRESELRQRATHDALTGLYNLFGLQQALDPALARREPIAVLFLDLDHFKDINDRHGHGTGDRLLQEVSKRLRRVLPRHAILARNGGDEFVVAVAMEQPRTACELAQDILQEIAKPFHIATLQLTCATSIGIALAPEHGSEREELLRCADIALYEAKTAGRGQYTLFEPAFDASLRERNDLLAAIPLGLLRDEFVVHYQPRVNPDTLAITSAEALVRWQHPERGLTGPVVFIALAESSGLIDALGAFVMEATIRQIAQWESVGIDVERVSVNVSQRQFVSGNLADNVRAMLGRHGVPGSRLEIEVTESLLGGDMASVRSQLLELRALGVTVAMDDFGTGYSSMSRLRDLPIDVMKVDRTFVKDLDSDPNAVAIAQTIVTLARAMDLRIVAEGVETQAQAAILATMGCDEFQGFLFAHALPPEDFARVFAAGIGSAT